MNVKVGTGRGLGFAAAIAAAFVCPGIAGFASAVEKADELRVIVYNVQFLPGLAGVVNDRGDPSYRAKTIGRAVAKFDIVGLNEVFDERYRELLLQQLRKAWGDDFHVIVSPKPDHRFNGGCAIASRLPFLAANTTVYSVGSSPKKYGFLADGFAAKGAVHARIQRSKRASDRTFVDVFVTHLESKDGAVRSVQYKELAAFVRKHADPKRPTLLMGDMNTQGNPSERARKGSAYHRMIETYRAARPGARFIDLWPHLKADQDGGTSRQLKPDGGKRIDYVFLYNPPAGPHRLEPLDVRVNKFRDPKVGALSDHSAVEGDLRWGGR